MVAGTTPWWRGRRRPLLLSAAGACVLVCLALRQTSVGVQLVHSPSLVRTPQQRLEPPDLSSAASAGISQLPHGGEPAVGVAGREPPVTSAAMPMRSELDLVRAELSAGRERARAHGSERNACSFVAVSSKADTQKRVRVGGPAVVYRGMQLWISERYRFILLRYQKVASTTSMVLARLYGAEMVYQGERWNGLLPKRYAGFFKFAFVRDPIRRLISSYNFRRPGDCRPPLPRCVPDSPLSSRWHVPGGAKHSLRVRRRELSRFVKSVRAGVAACALMDVHFHPQTPWLVAPDGSPRQLDFIGVADGPLYALGWKALSSALGLEPAVTDAVIRNATLTTLRVGRAESAIPASERGLLIRATELGDETARQICHLYAADYACLRAVGVAPLDARCASS